MHISYSRHYSRKALGALLLLLFFLGGCSVVPRELRKEVDRSISFSDLKENPEAYVGRKVILGGEIIETKNLQDQTQIEILQKPLGRGSVPLETDESDGRFLVYHPQYLDPATYQSGRYVTVMGEIMGGKDLKVGEAEYNYPVLTSKFLYLWPKARRYYGPYFYPYEYPYYPYNPYPYYPYDSFYFNWGLHYYSPLWLPWYYHGGSHGHHHSR